MHDEKNPEIFLVVLVFGSNSSRTHFHLRGMSSVFTRQFLHDPPKRDISVHKFIGECNEGYRRRLKRDCEDEANNHNAYAASKKSQDGRLLSSQQTQVYDLQEARSQRRPIPFPEENEEASQAEGEAGGGHLADATASKKKTMSRRPYLTMKKHLRLSEATIICCLTTRLSMTCTRQ